MIMMIFFIRLLPGHPWVVDCSCRKKVSEGAEREGKRFGAIVDGRSNLGSGGYYNTRKNKFEI